MKKPWGGVVVLIQSLQKIHTFSTQSVDNEILIQFYRWYAQNLTECPRFWESIHIVFSNGRRQSQSL